MQGKKNVVAVLNQLLTGELTAIDQYFVHAEMYRDWGLPRLYEHTWHEMGEERDHASKLVARILFLEGTPDVAARDKLKVGAAPKAMLENDLAVEYEVVAALRGAIALCEKEEDYVSREMLETLLDDTEEDHAHWLEQQLHLIRVVGEENYLQSQMGGVPGS